MKLVLNSILTAVLVVSLQHGSNKLLNYLDEKNSLKSGQSVTIKSGPYSVCEDAVIEEKLNNDTYNVRMICGVFLTVKPISKEFLEISN